MAEVIDVVANTLELIYSKIISFVPLELQGAFLVLVFGLLVAIGALFIWYFYRSLASKDLISLNLRQYNQADSPGVSKVLAVLLYFLEYLVIMPLLIFFWFAALSFVLLLIAEESSVQSILFLTAVMIAAIRILAYYHGEIAKDLAKLFPFITLSIFLLTPNNFNLTFIGERFREIPLLVDQAFSFFIIIFIVELILRIVSTITRLAKGNDLLNEVSAGEKE